MAITAKNPFHHIYTIKRGLFAVVMAIKKVILQDQVGHICAQTWQVPTP